MKNIFLFLVCLFLPINSYGFEKIHYGTDSGKDFTTLHVLAKRGIQLRDKPSTNSKILQKILYAEKVTVRKIMPDKKTTIDNIKGHWVKIVYGGKVGYAFDGYLSLFPPPVSSTIPDSNKLTTYYRTYCRYYPVCCGYIDGGKAELSMMMDSHGTWVTGNNELSLYSEMITLKDGFLIIKALFDLGEDFSFPTNEYKGKDKKPFNFKKIPEDNIWKSVYKSNGSNLGPGSYFYFVRRDNEMGNLTILIIEKTDFGIKIVKKY